MFDKFFELTRKEFVHYYEEEASLEHLENLETVLKNLADKGYSYKNRMRFYKLGERLFQALQKQLKESNKDGL